SSKLDRAKGRPLPSPRKLQSGGALACLCPCAAVVRRDHPIPLRPRTALPPGRWRAHMPQHRSPAMTTTINEAEIAKFTAMAEESWDPKGKFKPLHKFTPVRMSYIREHLLAHFGLDGTAMRPFEGLSILDVGCGGGLLCEPLARLGATVTGIDAAERNIAIARLHAEQSGLAIDYRATTSEAVAAAGERFDMVLNMEVV